MERQAQKPSNVRPFLASPPRLRYAGCREKSWCTGEDSNLRSSQGAADLQSAAINRSATCAHARAQHRISIPPKISRLPGRSRRPAGCAADRPGRASETGHNLRVESLRWVNGFLALAEFRSRLSGAGEGTRTPDRLITNQMLYQLSYASPDALFPPMADSSGAVCSANASVEPTIGRLLRQSRGGGPPAPLRRSSRICGML